MTFYIGKEPTIGNYAKMDSISAVNGQATYNLLKGGVAFAPQSANHVICSLNSIIQNPGSSFTISGSQITFASNLATGDSIDFILVLGDVLSIGVPSDDTIDSAKLKTNSVVEAKIQDDAVTRDKINAISTTSLPSFEAKGTSGQTDGYIQLNCEQNTHGIKLKSPPHSAGQSYTLTFPSTAPATDKFLKTDNSGNLSFAEAGGGAYEVIATADYSSAVNNFTITDCFTSTYQVYKVIGHNISGANGEKLFIQCLDSGGSAISGWDHVHSLSYVNESTGGGGDTYTSDNNLAYFKFMNYLFEGNTTQLGAFDYNFYQPYESTYTLVSGRSIIDANNGHTYGGGLSAVLPSSTSARSLKFYTSSSGNFTSYKVTVLGMKRS
jgi:hypothetical protein